MAGERIDGQVPFAGVDYNTKPARVSRSHAKLKTWMHCVVVVCHHSITTP